LYLTEAVPERKGLLQKFMTKKRSTRKRSKKYSKGGSEGKKTIGGGWGHLLKITLGREDGKEEGLKSFEGTKKKQKKKKEGPEVRRGIARSSPRKFTTLQRKREGLHRRR